MLLNASEPENIRQSSAPLPMSRTSPNWQMYKLSTARGQKSGAGCDSEAPVAIDRIRVEGGNVCLHFVLPYQTD